MDDVVDAAIAGMDANGDGIAVVGGRHVAVPFTIPGERVRVRLSLRGTSAAAALVAVLQPSPHRVAPLCRHFGPQPRTPPCGGCAWQHIAYPHQLALKTERVSRLVREAVAGAPAARPMLAATPDHPWGYRHKVHFVFGERAGPRGGLTMGHLARGSRTIVPVEHCPVHAAAGNTVAFALRSACRQAGVRAWRPGSRTAALRGLAVRVAGNGSDTLTTLVAAHDRDRRLREATRRALGDGRAQAATRGLHLNLHDRDDGMIFGRTTRRLHGEDRLCEEIGGVSFLVSPTAFFQTNVAAAAIVVGLVLDAVPAGATVLDLYAGAGLFALTLARRGHQVTAVEENREAVADGRASQRLNRIAADACRWMAAPVELAVGRLRPSGTVVLDPPREGCADGVLDHVFGRRGPASAIYVSCNPDTLGRDLRAIVRHGYRIGAVQPVDMFPHTPHIETVAVLERTPQS